MFPDYEEITLSREYEFTSGLSNFLKMQEPTTQHVTRALTSTQKYKNDKDLREFEKEKFLLALCCDLAPKDIELIAPCDYERLQMALLVLRADPDRREKMRTAFATVSPDEDGLEEDEDAELDAMIAQAQDDDQGEAKLEA